MAGGFSTTSAQRSTATSTVSSAVAVVNNPDGTGFAISGPALTADKVITQIVYVPGSNTSSGSSVVGGNGPTITGISYLDANNNVVVGETAVSTLGGNVLVTGTNFVANSLVYVNNSLVANTVLSSTQIILQAPANGSSNVALMIFNSSNIGYISNTSIRYSGIPTWSTTALSFFNNSSYNTSLNATSDSTLTYTLQAGSTLPTGMSLISSGYISGTPTGYSNATVFTPVIIATDLEGQATQQTITISVLVGEPYFPYTTLLTKTSGVNGANNSVFVDSSPNNFSITPTGGPGQGTFSPFSQTGWSNYFNGSTDYLQLPTASSAATAAAGAFTIEAWVYCSNISAGSYIAECWYNGVATSCSWSVFLTGTGYLALSYGIGATNNNVTGTSIQVAPNTWAHVAVTRDASNVIRLYVNGLADATTATVSGTLNTNASQGIRIGSHDSASHGWLLGWQGYISNVRFINGTALYTSTFTPSTIPLTAVTNTSLLTCQSNRFSDSSTNNFTITPNGVAAVLAFSPFSPTGSWSAATYGGSVLLNGLTGAGDYLTVPTNTALNFDTGDFTVEFWWYPTSIAADQGFLGGDTSGSYDFCWRTTTGFNIGRILVAFDNTFAFTPAVNNWYHVAYCRSGTSIRVFVNGAQVGTTVTNSNSYNTNSPGLVIGGSRSITRLMSGYISNLRLIKGTALYTSAFTPSTTPLTAIANTSFLLSGVNSGIYDAHSSVDLVSYGNPQSNTSQKKYATASISFSGTADYLISQATKSTIIGTGQFTIEGWFYYNSVSSQQYLIDTRATNTSSTGIALNSNASGYLVVTLSNSAAIRINTPFITSTWIHIAVCRAAANVVTCYINGSNVGGVTSTATLSDGILTIGTSIDNRNTGTTNHFNGYMEDLRITNGFARYTANFTPPTAGLIGQ
jgi:hypothetical protein